MADDPKPAAGSLKTEDAAKPANTKSADPKAADAPKSADSKATDTQPATGLPNKPGEPAFQMKIDVEKLVFKSDKLIEEPIAIELKLQNTCGKRQTFKVKCTSNEIFRVRPPLGFIEKDATAKIRVTFQTKEIPEVNKHFFAIYHMTAEEKPNDKAAQPRALWTPAAKPEACFFEKKDGTNWTVEKK